MANARDAPVEPFNARALSEAVSAIRARRGVEDPEILLRESLALLDSLSRAAPAASRRQFHVASPHENVFPEIDGGSQEIRKLKHHMLRIARDGDVTTLILGESGTGKERVARAIHRASPRCRAPFVVVNCAGLSPALIEDELFGHVRGAFTGAVDDRPGPFERADGGTVFLDEVGDLAPDLQMKLLRALQQRTVQRLGGRQEAAFDVRVIAATNVDLALARARGRFREDLYYRLKVYELRVPPLRRRGAGDIGALAAAILGRLAERRRRPPPALDSKALDLLTRHDWPGNVRELENTLECMMVAAGADSPLTTLHLPEGFARIVAPGASALPGPRPTPLSAAEILAALERHGSRCGRTAADLGLSRHQLYRLRKRHGVRFPGARTAAG
jgi:DNA-binding NtrC family response regulator